MNSLQTIALSGLNTAWMRADVAGHNVANANTEGFHRQVLDEQTAEGGGVTATVTQSPDVGVNLADEMVQEMVAEYSFKANIVTIKTADQMMGLLLDIMA